MVIPRSWTPWAQALGASALAVVNGASAATLTVDLSLPESPSGLGYDRPYLAVWVERAQDQTVAGTLAVWYDLRLRNNLGQTWLRQLRTWWRKTGESLTLPADGVSGATRPAGRHVLRYEADHAALAQLPQGDYALVVEVARERGGRDLVRAPFHWPGRATTAVAQTSHTQGAAELGDVLVRITP
jgi:hypothetical protein